MDKKKIKKEFNDFLDSATDEQLKDFLKFMKERRRKKPEEKAADQKDEPFKDRLN
ncbi:MULTISPECIES: hypothetical protein [Antarcticibacterium]|uniref:hypothetical protein n=1 Tax=Antarcticibacterium TaxID=2058174 RepID=UPI00143D2BF3|nr:MULTISPECIES: hypothetical protein [Antarcticibacterium]